jgi:hypothetical protein
MIRVGPIPVVCLGLRGTRGKKSSAKISNGPE